MICDMAKHCMVNCPSDMSMVTWRIGIVMSTIRHKYIFTLTNETVS